MALSGSSYKAFARHRLVAEWTATQNITSNQSTVIVKVFLQSMDGYGAMNAPASNAGSVKVNSATKNFTATSNLNNYQKKELTSQSFVVNHNADGTGSFSYSATYNINVTFAGVFYGNQTVSGSGTLNTIPRASTLSMNKTSATLGSTDVLFTITKASSNFKHDLYWSWEKDKFTTGKWGYLTGGYQTTSASITSKIPLEPFPSLMPTTSSTYIYIYLDTFNGNTNIGRKLYQIDIKLPDSIKPTVGRLTTEESVASTKNVLGTTSTTTYDFVQGMSEIKIGVWDVGAGQGSKIKRYEYYTKVGTDNEQKWGSNTTGYFTFNYTQYEYYNGEIELIAYTYDDRERYSRTSKKIMLHPYSHPTVNLVSVKRIGEYQTTVQFVYTGSVTSIKVGGVEKNFGKSEIQTIETSKDESVSANWWKSGFYTGVVSQTKDILNFDVQKSFKVWVGVTDSFGSSRGAYGTVSTAYTIMSLNKNLGVGFGKLHEQGTIDVAKTIYLEGNKISIHNKLLRLNDEDIVAYGKNTNGEYIWFNDGTMICWKNFVEATGACNVPYGSLFSTPNQIWTFPSGFHDYPAVSVHIVGGGAYIWGAHGAGGATKTTAPWMAYGAVSVGSKPQGSLIAIGRWKA